VRNEAGSSARGDEDSSYYMKEDVDDQGLIKSGQIVFKRTVYEFEFTGFQGGLIGKVIFRI